MPNVTIGNKVWFDLAVSFSLPTSKESFKNFFLFPVMAPHWHEGTNAPGKRNKKTATNDPVESHGTKPKEIEDLINDLIDLYIEKIEHFTGETDIISGYFKILDEAYPGDSVKKRIVTLTDLPGGNFGTEIENFLKEKNLMGDVTDISGKIRITGNFKTPKNYMNAFIKKTVVGPKLDKKRKASITQLYSLFAKFIFKDDKEDLYKAVGRLYNLLKDDDREGYKYTPEKDDNIIDLAKNLIEGQKAESDFSDFDSACDYYGKYLFYLLLSESVRHNFDKPEGNKDGRRKPSPETAFNTAMFRQSCEYLLRETINVDSQSSLFASSGSSNLTAFLFSSKPEQFSENEISLFWEEIKIINEKALKEDAVAQEELLTNFCNAVDTAIGDETTSARANTLNRIYREANRLIARRN